MIILKPLTFALIKNPIIKLNGMPLIKKNQYQIKFG